MLGQNLWRKLFVIPQSDYNEKVAQQILAHHYSGKPADTLKDRDLSDFGFRKYSQNGEDGILLCLFSLLGTTNKKVVEICAGNCVECNSANLILNHGWQGLLFDGDPVNIAMGKLFYRLNRDTMFNPPKLLNAWITKDSVNSLISGNGFSGEIDLLSLDLDGVDWWIWKGISVINPRVVVVEYNDRLGPELSLTVPYSDSFTAAFIHDAPVYSGASLAAFVKLARQKGYILVGVENLGFNAFFVRKDVAKNLLTEKPVKKVFYRPATMLNLQNGISGIDTSRFIRV